MSDAPFRVLPAITDRNRGYWTAGRDGVLRFQRCQACRYWIHPHSVLCPRCHAPDIAYEPVSGRATVHTYTVNHQPWMPVPELPFVLAVVALPEQDGLRLTTVIVDCPVDDVHIDMPVEVTFEAHEDDEVWIPMFRPVADAEEHR
ncbi:MAG: hypothetical protein AMXMBFR46_20260 [Acidimicrobiia bacterium]